MSDDVVFSCCSDDLLGLYPKILEQTSIARLCRHSQLTGGGPLSAPNSLSAAQPSEQFKHANKDGNPERAPGKANRERIVLYACREPDVRGEGD